MNQFFKFSVILFTVLFYFGFAEIKVTYVGGEAYIKRGSENRRITQNMSILPGDVITTSQRSFVALALDDGSVHKISANTVYEVQKNQANDESRTQLFSILKGKIFSFVSKTFKSSDIKFLTPTAVVGVRGTAFVIEVEPKNTVVYLIEGRVDLTRSLNDINPPTPLSQGNKAIMPPQAAPIIEPMNQVDYEDAAKDIPLSLGEVILNNNNDDESIALEGQRQTVDEVRGYVDESVARVEAQREELNQNRIWDHQSGKTIGQFRVRQVVSTPADNEVAIVTYTLDTHSGKESSLNLNMVFDQVVPSYQDVVNGATRNIDKVDWRISITKGGVGDNLFYSKDYKKNTEEVYFNNAKGDDLNSRQLTIKDSNVRIPTAIKFKINGGEYLINFGYSYINGDASKYSDIIVDSKTDPTVYKKVLNGDVDTRINVIAFLPNNSIAKLLQNGESFNIILINGFIFPLFNKASGI